MQASIGAATLKQVAEIVSRFVQEGAVTFDGSLKFEAMDPARISAVYLNLPRSAFEVEGEPTAETFGLSWEDLNRILGRVDKEDKVLLETSGEATAGRLKITAAGRSVKQFSMPLLDLETYAMPNIDLGSQFGAECRELLNAVDSVTVMGGQAVGVGVDGEGRQAVLSIWTDDEVYGRAEVTLGPEAYWPTERTTTAKAVFNADYLRNALRGDSGTVIVQLETDKPMKIKRSVAGGSLDILLAPRVEEGAEVMTDKPVSEATPGKTEVQQDVEAQEQVANAEVEQIHEADRVIEQIKEEEEEEEEQPSLNVRRLMDTATDDPAFDEILHKLTDEEIDYLCRNLSDTEAKELGIFEKVEEEVERRKPK